MKDRSRIPAGKSASDFVWCEYCGKPFERRKKRNDHTQDEHL